MTDKYGRIIDYLRISITDRCNLRCVYCMPPEGVPFKPHDNILKYEEILKIVEVGVELGINKVRITGGEPLARKDVVELINGIRKISGIKDISMTTNGTLLPKYAYDLKKAGLSRINISLDSLNPNTYKKITRRDEFAKAMEGIKSAFEAGLKPVKINVVVMKGINGHELKDFINFARDKEIHVRFIEYMPIGDARLLSSNYYFSLNAFKNELIDKWGMVPTDIKNSGPSMNYKMSGMKGSLGFITAISHNFCSKCNRMRLTADGFLRPCLASDMEIDMHDEYGNITKETIRKKFEEALNLKPVNHNFYTKDSLPKKNMSQIGG